MRLIMTIMGLLASHQFMWADETVDYAGRVKPVLQSRCYACHGILKHEGGLRLDTAALAVKGGDSGAVIQPRDAEGSVLIQRIAAMDATLRMPPEGEPLKPDEIRSIRAWIVQGAVGPVDEMPERDPRDHWAFQTPIRPPVPLSTNPVGSINPIDAFIASMRERHGLKAQPPATKEIWLRRVMLDLIGLPPTADELRAFVADDSEQAFDTVVTRLLDSPQYGERWGRHWMDIWRYSDWWGLGEDARNSQKHIWHWRDWIVDSLNADKGYDQMLREMLAADELYPEDPDRLRAGGFLGRQYFKFNRTSWLDETIEHTAKAMLGLTFNCAKCHDHKYDPFSQADYYRFRAVFEPYQVRLDATNGVIDFEKDGIPRPFDCNLDAKTYLHIRGDDRNPDTSQVMEPAFPAFLTTTAVPPPIEPVSLPAMAIQPGLRRFVVEAYLQQAETRIIEKRAEFNTARQRLAEAECKEQSPPIEQKQDSRPSLEQSNGDQRVEAAGGQNSPLAILPVDQARLAATVAEKSLAWAEAQPSLIRARSAADHARFSKPPADNAIDLARAAVRLERLAAIAKTDEEQIRAELELLRVPADKKAEAEKKRVSARSAYEAAQKALDEPGESYTSVRGASKVLESNLETEESRLKPFPASSTGRRTALAKWITDPRHPLTARVAVNHIWSRHFGRPLVPTVFDFGRKGSPPTHPELLDWLATELIQRDHNQQGAPWSMKHIHRLIVTSETYRMSSSNAGAARENLLRDPDNQFYWRMNPIRMQSQVVRDALLHLAGELDPTMGGPPIPIQNESSQRRSLYFIHSNIQHEKFLSMFDDASVLDCYRRAESIVPQQALALENSPLATEIATKIALQLSAQHPNASDQDFIRATFYIVLASEPSPAELNTVIEAWPQFLAAAKLANKDNPQQQARISIVQALLNHNDFVTIR